MARIHWMILLCVIFCSQAFGTGGDPEPAQEPQQRKESAPTVNPQVTDPTIVINTDPTDWRGVAMKYGLPALGTLILGLVVLWWKKRHKPEDPVSEHRDAFGNPDNTG